MRTLPGTTDRYGDLSITPLGHGSLYLQYNGETIAVDPYSEVADYEKLPQATLIIMTHDHYDHYDPAALKPITTDQTTFVGTVGVAERLQQDGFPNPVIVLSNCESATYKDIRIHAVPAYNTNRRNDEGNLFHPPGYGNGYVLEIGGKRVYIAGDTEPIEAMKGLGHIDIAFLPQNLPYTMTFDELTEAARMVDPAVLYPYHYSEIDRQKLQEALPGTEIR